LKLEHVIASSGALYVVLMKFVWCTPFSFGHSKLEKGRKYQRKWCECYQAEQWRKADCFGEVFSRKQL